MKQKKKKNSAAVALGKLGGNARASTITAERKAEIAKLAVAARWPNRKETK
jgi:type III secretion system FlhB-like substrate exporter